MIKYELQTMSVYVVDEHVFGYDFLTYHKMVNAELVITTSGKILKHKYGSITPSVDTSDATYWKKRCLLAEERIS